MRISSIVIIIAIGLLAGCTHTPKENNANFISSKSLAESRQSMLREIKGRNAKAEFDARVKSGALYFYAIGSGVEGYSMPGLTQKEVDEIVRNNWKWGCEFLIDHMWFASQEYWDATTRFASEYNRLVYKYLTKAKQ